MERLNQGMGQPSDGVMFVDIVSNLEHMSDYAVKIAKQCFRLPLSILKS